MKKSLFGLLTFILFGLLISCNKDPLCELADDEARLQGYVLEKGTKKPVEGAK